MSHLQIIEDAAFLTGHDAFMAGKSAVPARDAAVIALIKKHADGKWSIANAILAAWASGWHNANANATGDSLYMGAK